VVRVVHVVESFLSGTFEVIRTICSRLDPARFDVWVLHSLREHSPADYRELFPPHVNLVRVAMRRDISPWRDAAAFAAIVRQLVRLRPEVVHTHSSKAGVLGRAAAALTGVPRVFHTPHGYAFLMDDRRRGLYRSLERCAGRVGTTIAVSRAEAEYARSVARRVRIVPNAVDVPDLSAPEANVVASCGRITSARNPELVERVARAMPGERFVWIGDGEARGGLSRVEVTGWLPRAESLRRLASAAVLLHPSKWEGMPLVVTEAMALGRPVVASDIPAHRELIEHGRTGFLAAREIDFVSALRELLRDPALRARIGSNARIEARSKFSPDEMARRYAELYDP